MPLILLDENILKISGEAFSAGTVGAIIAIGNTAAVVGFGGVAKNVPAFTTAVEAMTNIPGSP